jgi:hypothetical protein
MTTAFELGCLSAMEKIAGSEGRDPTGRRSAWRPGERSGFNDAVNFMGNVAGEVPSVAGDYLNAAGRGLSSVGNAFTGGLNSIGNMFKSTGPTFEQQRIINRQNREFGAAVPTNAPVVGSKLEPVADLHKRLYGAAQSPEQRAAQKALDASAPDVNAQYYENLAKFEAAQNAAKGIPSHDGMATGLNPTIESKQNPAAPKNYQGLAPNAALLKNPYVIGGLGAGALGLGGYAAYRAYQNSKKKKSPM